MHGMLLLIDHGLNIERPIIALFDYDFTSKEMD